MDGFEESLFHTFFDGVGQRLIFTCSSINWKPGLSHAPSPEFLMSYSLHHVHDDHKLLSWPFSLYNVYWISRPHNILAKREAEAVCPPNGLFETSTSDKRIATAILFVWCKYY